jgi:protein-S-isoprenylcysteine O-methyltransferase Ste14
MRAHTQWRTETVGMVVGMLFRLGLAVAVLLLSLLLLTVLVPSLRIWPARGTWQRYVFWPLFRGLNVLCFMMAVADRTVLIGLPIWLRTAAAVVLAASVTLFVYAFRVLGRDNSYGAQDGLVTRGIYRWTRNPQNAMLMVVYGALAVTADSGPTYLLCAAMIAVYFLMVLLEEPWLTASYGGAYRSYCQRVPRFFNWRRAAIVLRARLRRLRPASHPTLKAHTE